MKVLKSIVSVFVCVALCLCALGVTAFADDTIQIVLTDTLEGHTYTVYQILTGTITYDEDTGEYSISDYALGSSISEGISVYTVLAAIDSNSGDELGAALYELVDADVAVMSVTGTGENKVLSLSAGYYLIVDSEYGTSSDYSLYVVAAVTGETTEVALKNTTSTPTVTKTITSDGTITDSNDVNTAAIGDAVSFEISSTVVVTTGYTYYTYTFYDTLGAGFTYNNDLTVSIGGVTLTADTSESTGDYSVTVTTNSDGTTSIVVEIHDVTGYTAGSAILIDYTATLNENADLESANINSVYLAYEYETEDGETITGKTPVSTTYTYTTSVEVVKVDEDGNALSGATFSISGENLTSLVVTVTEVYVEDEDGTYYLLADGTYTETAPGDETVALYSSITTKYSLTTSVTIVNSETTGDTVSATTGETGTITFAGLNSGEYTLSETTAPDGYVATDDIVFTITATVETDDDGNVIFNSSTGEPTVTWTISSESSDDWTYDESTGTWSVTVVNYSSSGFSLPFTGGEGTTMFYIAGFGLILVAAAGAVLLIRKRRALV